MKKLILTLGLLCFIFFGALAVQNISTSTFGVGIENIDLDKDPVKDGDKKAKEANQKDSKTASIDAGDEECAPKDAKAGCSTKSSCCSSKGKSGAKVCPDKK